jgi:hypothetical protein
MSWIRNTAEGVERQVASYPASVLANERSLSKSAKSEMTFKWKKWCRFTKMVKKKPLKS